MKDQPYLETSPKVSDEIKKTTCYMCACRCGIDVHIKDGKVAYIEGNKDHPVNQGVLCAKGSAGIMQVNAPSRLDSPMKRVGPRGSGEFKKISWDEALTLAVEWLKPLRKKAPEKLAFFTGRDQSQSFTSYFAQMFGTPNYAAHGGFCSVNMATAGIYTMGGSFWEFGQPDWDYTKLFILFGVAEDHDSNPIKMGIGKIKDRGAKIVGVNPIRTGYNAVADEWLGITPGTDGLLILSLINVLIKAGKIDLEYLAKYTNAPVFLDPESGLFLKDENDKPLVKDRISGKVCAFDTKGIYPDLNATYRVRGATSTTVFHDIIKKYISSEYDPETVADVCGISAQKIRALANEIAKVAFEEEFELPIEWTDFRGEKHKVMKGRPVSFHSMRGISAHSNGFQTCRALHILQILLGTVEVPGGFRFKPPYPKPSSIHPKPHFKVTPDAPLDGPHLGFVHGPEDLALDDNGKPVRIDKAFSWENPMSAHGLMHMVISNAYAGDPYKIDTLFMYMANMSWNSSMNTSGVMNMLTDKDEKGEYVIPRIIYSDAYSSEMVAYADLILPDTTYLERHDCISLLDRPISEADGAADAIRWPVIEPDRDVRGFQSVIVDLGARLGLPGFINEDGSPKYKDYADYIVNHLRKPDIGPLAGFRGDGSAEGRGSVNPKQLEAYIENGGFYVAHIPDEAKYFKPWNSAYQNWAVELGLYDSPMPYIFNLYSEPMRKFQLAAEGVGEQQPPEHLREQLKAVMSPLPIWYSTQAKSEENNEYPIHALTQRPMAMYHSWGSQNAWLRQIHGLNPLYVPTKLMKNHNLKTGDWVKLSSIHNTITVPVAEMAGLNENTVWTWNAIGKRKGAWALDPNAPEATKGFLLNHLIHELQPAKGDGLRWSNSDPVTGQAAWFDLKVKLEKTTAPKESQPSFKEIKSPVGTGPKNISWKVGN
ncbi:MAG: molybdopterin oxidoreductase family protein [Paracoccaceae bacterium]|jgi:anaerobic selenocysteine-containing dehydrogenase|nr:MAG: formate dehydrogenase [Paracoccaceae bacterium]|tara:strand:+ start:5487 stop:8288 length:2802 start_codon:yes stop_codon:yes gene_type:complete